jgi:hypothetical protein
VPLYLAHIIEQAAFRHWLQRHAPAHAPGNAASAGSAATPDFQVAGSAGSLLGSSRRSQQSVSSSSSSASFAASTSSGAGSSSSSLRQRVLSSIASVGSVSLSSTSISSGRDAEARAYAILFPENEQQQRARLGDLLNPVLNLPSAYMRWCVHVVLLTTMLICSWAVSNTLMLGLLPRLLSRQQLDRWCPNRPFTPYVIAGQVYEGL